MKLSLEAAASLGTQAVQGSQAPRQHQEMKLKAIRAQISLLIHAWVSSQLREVLVLVQEVLVQKPEKRD